MEEKFGSLNEVVTTTKTAIEQIGTAVEEQKSHVTADIEKVPRVSGWLSPPIPGCDAAGGAGWA